MKTLIPPDPRNGEILSESGATGQSVDTLPCPQVRAWWSGPKCQHPAKRSASPWGKGGPSGRAQEGLSGLAGSLARETVQRPRPMSGSVLQLIQSQAEGLTHLSQV